MKTGTENRAADRKTEKVAADLKENRETAQQVGRNHLHTEEIHREVGLEQNFPGSLPTVSPPANPAASRGAVSAGNVRPRPVPAEAADQAMRGKVGMDVLSSAENR